MTPLLLTQLAQALEAIAAALRAVPVAAAPEAPAREAVPTLLTVRQLCAKHPALRPATVYGWLACRETNGLCEAVLHLPNSERLLIDETAFFGWLEKFRERPRVFEVPRRGGRKAAVRGKAPPLPFPPLPPRQRTGER